LTNSKIEKRLLFLFFILIASNQVTKAFFWTAHQQMFIFFAPLFCIYAGLKLINNGLSYQKTLLLSFISGVLMLCYGNFLLMLPILIFAYSFSQKKTNGNIIRDILVKNIFLIILFAIPASLWMIILKIHGSDFYISETAKYRQLVWIIDTLHISFYEFIKVLIKNVIYYAKTLKGIVFFIILFIGLYVYSGNPLSIKRLIKNRNSLLISFVFITFFSYYCILGFYAERLTFTLVPILLCSCIFLIGNSNKKINIYVFALVVIAWCCYNIFSYGPFD
jgi:hypothetical protein